MFCEKGVLKNLAKFTGKHPCQSLFFNQVAGPWPAKRLWHRCFLVNFSKFLRIFFYRTPPVAASFCYQSTEDFGQQKLTVLLTFLFGKTSYVELKYSFCDVISIYMPVMPQYSFITLKMIYFQTAFYINDLRRIICLLRRMYTQIHDQFSS